MYCNCVFLRPRKSHLNQFASDLGRVSSSVEQWAFQAQHLKQQWAYQAQHLKQQWAYQAQHLKQQWAYQAELVQVGIPMD